MEEGSWLEKIVHPVKFPQSGGREAPFNRASSKSKTFLAFCFCFIFGAGVIGVNAGFFRLTGRAPAIFGLAIGLVGLAIVFWRSPTTRLWLAGLAFLFFGVWRGALASAPLSAPSYFFSQKINFTAVVAEEPEIKEGGADFILSNLIASNPFSGQEEKIPGRLLLKAPLYPRRDYGDRLRIFCRPERPKNFSVSFFQYDKYLAAGGVNYVCRFAETEKIFARAGNPARAAIFSFKEKVRGLAERLWPEPESSLMAGLFFGTSVALPAETENNFRRAGLSHIVAVSGYNVSLVAAALFGLALALGLSRRRAFWPVAVCLAAFVVLAGGSASVIRAALMAVLVLLAEKIGRPAAAGRLLFFAAAAMLALNPWLLLFDPGFQLSFAATAGLVWLAPFLEKFFPSVLASTLAAALATLPISLCQFGTASVSVLFSNLLVLWLVPFLMLLGFVSLIVAALFFPLGQGLAWAIGFGLKYVIMTASVFGGEWAQIKW